MRARCTALCRRRISINAVIRHGERDVDRRVVGTAALESLFEIDDAATRPTRVHTGPSRLLVMGSSVQ